MNLTHHYYQVQKAVISLQVCLYPAKIYPKGFALKAGLYQDAAQPIRVEKLKNQKHQILLHLKHRYFLYCTFPCKDYYPSHYKNKMMNINN